MLVKDLIERLRATDPEIPVVFANDAGTIFDVNTTHKVHIKLKVNSFSGERKYDFATPSRQADLFAQEDDGIKALLIG